MSDSIDSSVKWPDVTHARRESVALIHRVSVSSSVGRITRLRNGGEVRSRLYKESRLDDLKCKNVTF